MSTSADSQRMEKIVSLCKRRGFIFQSSEIYGGLNGLWDYGPLGVRRLVHYFGHRLTQITQMQSLEFNHGLRGYH